jgi:hypothetical protein
MLYRGVFGLKNKVHVLEKVLLYQDSSKNILLNFSPLLYKSNIKCMHIQQIHRNKTNNQKTVTSVEKTFIVVNNKIELKFF